MHMALVNTLGPIIAQYGYNRPGVRLLGLLLLIVLVLVIIYLIKRIAK
jgi:hypothetical protein